MSKYLLILICFVMMSCSTAGHRLAKVAKIEKKITKTEQVINKNSKAYIDGVVKSLSRIPNAQRLPEVELALRLADNTQTLLGQPEPDLIINIDDLLSGDLDKQKFEEERLLNIETVGKKALVDKLDLIRERDELQKEIAADLAKRVAEEQKSLWWKIKSYGAILILSIVGIATFAMNPMLFSTVFGAITGIFKSIIKTITGIFN